MKINKIALLASLMFATSGTSAILASMDNTEEVVSTKKASFLSDYSWMHIGIFAIVLIVLLVIVMMWWNRRRGSKKA